MGRLRRGGNTLRREAVQILEFICRDKVYEDISGCVIDVVTLYLLLVDKINKSLPCRIKRLFGGVCI